MTATGPTPTPGDAGGTPTSGAEPAPTPIPAPTPTPTPGTVVHGHRVQGAVSGLVFGLGVAILLQQFGVVPLTTLVLLLVPLGAAVAGVGLGWPRHPAPSS